LSRDPLTGLLDRYAFQHRLQQSIDERRQGALGVVTLDVNRFKEVNESLGWAMRPATPSCGPWPSG
jgi:GGDEF domain-containing protein